MDVERQKHQSLLAHGWSTCFGGLSHRGSKKIVSCFCASVPKLAKSEIVIVCYLFTDIQFVGQL